MLNSRRVWLAACALLLFASTPSLAQQPPSLGLTAGYPATVGVLWQVSDRLALRPDISWNWGSTESTTSIDLGTAIPAVTLENSSDNTTVVFGVSGLFTLRHSGPLRLIVGGRVGYSTGDSTSTSQSVSFSSGPSIAPSLPVTISRTTKSESNGYAIAGLFGGQYALGERAALFAEVGPSYQSSKQTSELPVNEARTHSTGVRSAVGLIFYF